VGTVFRAIGAYWFLLFVVRVIGRRRTQMTPFEYILIFLIGGMSIQAIVSDDRSLTNAFVAIAAIGLMHVLVAWLKHRFPKFAKVADGTPVVIIEKGQIDRRRMDQLRLQDQDIMAAARVQGIKTLDQIRYAIVERSGEIAVIKESGDSQ
jgi:uncharacterized membrane protein YcaP (DUF421 family)